MRAVEIIRGVTNGKLRFALDTVGKQTATHLQEALHRSTGGITSHLVGLTGIPKVTLSGVKYHKVPIKIFHAVGRVGEKTMDWLENLLREEIIISPEVDVADGGLSGINEALDRLRRGHISGKRLVVPIGSKEVTRENSETITHAPDGIQPIANESIPNDTPEHDSVEGVKNVQGEDKAAAPTTVQNDTPKDAQSNGVDGSPNENKNLFHSLEYADKINEDPSRIKFA